jgi:hypothetical protein
MKLPEDDALALKHVGAIRIEHQYSETNVMHFLFILLTIKGLYMFRALLDHLQEALHKST